MTSEDPAVRPDSSLMQLTRGGLQTFAVKVISIALGFGSHMLLANLLGKVAYGEFAFAVTTLQFLVIAAVLGADSVATRFVAQYQESPERLLSHVGWLNQRTLRHSAILAISGILVFQMIRSFDDRLIWLSTQLILIALPIQAYAILRQGILRGLQKPVLSILPEGILRPFFTIKFSLASVFLIGVLANQDQFSNQFESRHAVIVYILVTVVALIAGQIFLSWFLPRSGEKRGHRSPPSGSDIQLWKSMALASMFSAFAMTVHSQSDVWMLGVLTDAQNVGPYSIAAKYAGFVIFGINAVNTALGPLIAKSMHNRDELQRLAAKAAYLSFTLGTVIGVLLILVPDFLLNLFGAGFSEASPAFRLLVAANWLNVACGSVGLLLSMTGNHQAFMRILLSSVALNIILDSALIPWFDMMGAALATAISVVYWNVLALIVVKIRLKIRPTIGGLL